jgi:uncharacterized protein involved in response to NO
MSFPACRHKKKRPERLTPAGLSWLAAEPYRVFFVSGALWSVVAAMLWPLFYAHHLGYYPSLVHARLMIQAFGGAFVIGFLGTAGPRLATAPKLTPVELIWLFLLHQANAVAHLCLHPAWGDVCFLGLLGSLLAMLVVRFVRYRQEAPPPQMLLALVGLLCGVTGTALLLAPATLEDAGRLRMAQLLLHQGLLLPPVLGIGSFVFPRMLGGGFGESASSGEVRARLVRAVVVAVGIVASFVIEASGHPSSGLALRAVVATAYLAREVRWRRQPGDVGRGSLTTGLYCALGLGLAGLVLAGIFYPAHVSILHLLYIGGFGLLMLVVASRVLFGHSGDLAGFFRRSHWVRFLVGLGVLTAVTRAVPAWVPAITVTHHIYAALTWSLLSLFWLVWHRRRFVKRDESEDD